MFHINGFIPESQIKIGLFHLLKFKDNHEFYFEVALFASLWLILLDLYVCSALLALINFWFPFNFSICISNILQIYKLHLNISFQERNSSETGYLSFCCATPSCQLDFEDFLDRQKQIHLELFPGPTILKICPGFPRLI